MKLTQITNRIINCQPLRPLKDNVNMVIGDMKQDTTKLTDPLPPDDCGKTLFKKV